MQSRNQVALQASRMCIFVYVSLRVSRGNLWVATVHGLTVLQLYEAASTAEVCNLSCHPSHGVTEVQLAMTLQLVYL